MKFTAIASKGLKETLRDKRRFLSLLLFPLIFMLMFGLVFGSTGNTTPHDIVVINQDAGTILQTGNTTQPSNFGNSFTEFLENAKYENSSMNIFSLHNVSADQATNLVKSQDIDAIVIIPQNFSQAFTSFINDSARTEITSRVGEQIISNPASLDATQVQLVSSYRSLPQTSNATATLVVIGDPGFLGYSTTQSLLGDLLEQYTNGLQANIQVKVAHSGFGATAAMSAAPISIAAQPLAGTTSFTQFDYQAPGIVIFGVLIEVSSISQVLAGESDRGTLNRLKLSKMRSSDLFIGSSIPWMFVAALQVIILFGVAVMLGFHWQGGIVSLLFAIVIGVLAGIASIALGLLVAAFARTERQAGNLGLLFAVPISFLTGAFFPLPKVYVGTLFGQPVQIFEIFPWFNAANALRSVLVFGTGIGAVAYDIALIIIPTIILFLIGIVAFSRTRLEAQE